MKTSLLSLKSQLRTSALLEGISFLLLLFIAMPLKYFVGIPEYVRYIGMAHGILFIWYIIVVFIARDEYQFNTKQSAISIIASLVPFGTFYADAKVFKNLK